MRSAIVALTEKAISQATDRTNVLLSDHKKRRDFDSLDDFDDSYDDVWERRLDGKLVLRDARTGAEVHAFERGR